MRWLRNAPIKQKLFAASLISSGAALLLLCAGFVAYEFGAYREATIDRLASVAGVIASNSSSALNFDDPDAAETTLSALRGEQKIVRACIYDSDGELFAAYHRDELPVECHYRDPAEKGRKLEGNAVAFSLPITLDGDSIGTILIRSDPIDLKERLVRYGGILGLVILASSLASFPLASRLQRFISVPILRLVETSKRISAEKDFSVRAVGNGEDELGILVGAFNDMLEQIEARDRALARHRENLEEEVESRTAELKAVNEALKNEISQRQQAEERIRRLAYYDGLTGLPNRQLFQERLQRAVASAKHEQTYVALLFLDLDRFKQVNDTLGHSVGDDLLCNVSERLLSSVRFTDSVAGPDLGEPETDVSRLGGDEFTVLLTRISDPHVAATVAQRLLDELSKPLPVGGYELYTTASVGIAVYPFDGEDPETLLRNADTAMYHAKNQHRHSFKFYTEAMNATASRKLHLAGRLRHSLERRQLSLHYQPLRETDSGRVTAAEALLRWNDPEAGPVGPDEFIPIAEDTGMIVPIGEWVLRTACAQGRSWREAGFRQIRISVNVSTHQLRHPSWLGTVARVLQETGLSPADLELEVTESAILEHDDATISALKELDEMGVGLALDDFGTGYSSLSYLRRFPIERVKIDRSFVGDITANPEDAALTTAILAMAHSLQLKVVAEGVETLEQAEFLRERGCHELQGYLFSPPVPADEFTRFLEREKPE